MKNVKTENVSVCLFWASLETWHVQNGGRGFIAALDKDFATLPFP